MVSIQPPLSGAQIHDKRLAIPGIEAFAPGLVGDGVTDDSAPFKAAHDAATVAGVSVVYCANQYYIPSAYLIGNVCFVGPGAILGHNFKRVAPMSAQSGLAMIGRGVSPAVHMRRVKATSTPKVLLVGDSRSTFAANFLTPLDNIWSTVRKHLRRSNPGKTFSFIDYAISGTTWNTFTLTSTTDPDPTGHAGFSWVAGVSWKDQVLAQQADLIIFSFGMNGASAPGDMIGSCNYVCGGAKAPDLIFLTAPPPSFIFVNAAGQDERLRNAGLMRSISESGGAGCGFAAAVPPIGLVDASRMTTRMSRGYDPSLHIPTRVLTNIRGLTNTAAVPYVLPRCKDIDIRITLVGAGAVSVNPNVTLLMDGAQGYNTLNIDNGGGGAVRARYVLLNGGTTLTNSGGTSPVLPSSGDLFFRIIVKNSWLYVTCNVGILFDAPITRYDAEYDMTIKTTLVGANMTIDYVSVGVADACLPSLTDNDVWGATANLPGGGSTGNHEAAAGIACIERTFAMTDLCAG